jgi:hypothetical protein
MTHPQISEQKEGGTRSGAILEPGDDTQPELRTRTGPRQSLSWEKQV